MTPAQWLVLDNLAHNWPYTTNLDRQLAEDAYLWAVRNEYIKDGQITLAGRGALAANPCPREEHKPC